MDVYKKERKNVSGWESSSGVGDKEPRSLRYFHAVKEG